MRVRREALLTGDWVCDDEHRPDGTAQRRVSTAQGASSTRGEPVLRDSAARAAARIARPVGLVAVLAWLAGAPCALAQQGTTSVPEELWRAYPLEQTATTTAPSPPAAAPDTSVSSDDGAWGPSWVVAAVAGAAGGVLAGAAGGGGRGPQGA